MSIASGSSSSSSLGQSYFRETHSRQIPVVEGACGAGGAGCQLFGFLDSITTEPVKTDPGMVRVLPKTNRSWNSTMLLSREVLGHMATCVTSTVAWK
jgi:hypothetical protein